MADEDLIPVVIPPGLPPGTTMAVIHNGSQVLFSTLFVAEAYMPN